VVEVPTEIRLAFFRVFPASVAMASLPIQELT
jgi:hypothetical protein